MSESENRYLEHLREVASRVVPDIVKPGIARFRNPTTGELEEWPVREGPDGEQKIVPAEELGL